MKQSFAVGTRNHWYEPALTLRKDIERTDGAEAARRFIRAVLNSSSPAAAMETVARYRAEWDKHHATER